MRPMADGETAHFHRVTGLLMMSSPRQLGCEMGCFISDLPAPLAAEINLFGLICQRSSSYFFSEVIYKLSVKGILEEKKKEVMGVGKGGQN